MFSFQVWIKLIFFFQSASMTVLYPYLNLHMKSLGISVQEVSVINAVIPILFIFTPPLAGFMAERIGNFRILLSVLTAMGGLFALLLLTIPPARDVTKYPVHLKWGLSCGRPGNQARFQKLMLHGFKQVKQDLCSTSFKKLQNYSTRAIVLGTVEIKVPNQELRFFKNPAVVAWR